ncbi:MAG TPA: hypothetical protein PKH39_12630 [Woeseiaceae bacterium]|nr:hypothetical protein [Woeseiaceae bacterium]
MTIATTILLSFVVILAVVGAMGIGVLAGRQPIKGSCGGLGGGPCELCSGKCPNRDSDGGGE